MSRELEFETEEEGEGFDGVMPAVDEIAEEDIVDIGGGLPPTSSDSK